MNKYHFGKQFETRNSGVCTLIKYVNNKEVYVIFADGTFHMCSSGNLTLGAVKNPNQPTVFGVGINDLKIDGCNTDKVYTLWYSMLRRCYSEVYQKKKPSYKGVTVSEDWLRLSNFAKDILDTPFYEMSLEGDYELDKDLLGDGMFYSKETCCFLPREINSFLCGGYTKSNLPVGVSFNKRLGKYIATMGEKGKASNHLGVYKTVEEASNRYRMEKRRKASELADMYKGFIDEKVYEYLKDFD